MPQRTFGPFSGAQLTVIIVATLAFLLPGTLWAVAPFQRVAIQDHGTGKLSHVDAGRRLSVYDPINGAAETPANFVRFYNFSSGSAGCIKIAAPPAGKALILKTLALDVFNLSGTGTGHVFRFYVGANCLGSAVLVINPNSVGLVTANLEPGLAIPAGRALWKENSASVSGEVNGLGYIVPAAWVPANPPNITPTAAPASASGQNLPQ
jgi:hypothetical protein